MRVYAIFGFVVCYYSIMYYNADAKLLKINVMAKQITVFYFLVCQFCCIFACIKMFFWK